MPVAVKRREVGGVRGRCLPGAGKGVGTEPLGGFSRGCREHIDDLKGRCRSLDGVTGGGVGAVIARDGYPPCRN